MSPRVLPFMSSIPGSQSRSTSPPISRSVPRSILVVLAAVLAFALLAAPAPSAAGPPEAAPAQASDSSEAGSYKLTVATMNKVEKAYRDFAAAVEANPELRAQLEDAEPPDADDEGAIASIDDAVAQMEGILELAKAVKGAGLKMREVVLFSYVLAGTAMAASVVDAGVPFTPSDDSPAFDDNMRWFRENHEAVERFLETMGSVFPDDEEDEEDAEDWTGGEVDSSAVFEE